MKKILNRVVILMMLFSCAALSAQGLKNNPFVQPVDLLNIKLNNNNIVVPPPVELELRAILLAGKDSLANINGDLIGIGDEILGYRLVSVNDGQALIVKKGQKRLLKVK